MLQENQESVEPPRQSASFKVLQEILETGTGVPLVAHSSLRYNVPLQVRVEVSEM